MPTPSPKSPNLSFEIELAARGHSLILGIDEVGRGAIAGPVAVGISVLELGAMKAGWPAGLKDSKLLSEPKRQQLIGPIKDWLLDYSVGYSSASEIDELGIISALTLAAQRAFATLQPFEASAIAVLDGTHNWLVDALGIEVLARAKADRDCATVAAASVLAKVQRDNLMIKLADQQPVYGWKSNKGYASAEHIAAIQEFGIDSQHRATWLGKILT